MDRHAPARAIPNATGGAAAGIVDAQAEPPSGGLWRRFRRRHLHDYPDRAAAVWCTIVAAGAISTVAALVSVAHGGSVAVETLGTLLLVAIIGTLAIRVPRTSYTLSFADIFTFAAMALLGPAAGALAAGVDTAIANVRNTRRLSSRLASPASAVTAWLIAGLGFESLRDWLEGVSMERGLATLVALGIASPLPYLLTTFPLLAMLSLKRGDPLRPATWFAESSWSAAVYIGSALVAGLIYMAVLSHGVIVIAVAGILTLAGVAMLKHTIARLESAHRQQEAQVDQARAAAAASQERFEAAFTHAAIGMTVVDPDGVVLQANEALGQLADCRPDRLVGRAFADLLHPDDRVSLALRIADIVRGSKGAFELGVRLRRVDGTERRALLHTSPYRLAGVGLPGLIHQLQDVTARHDAEQRLHHIAYHDGLTGLPNRHCFHERLEAAVASAGEERGSRFAVMFLDLDRFKTVNDSLGHMAGNQLLRTVSQRLAACIRPDDLVARLGGDEFALLVGGLDESDYAMRLAQRVLNALEQPVPLDGTEVSVGASIGVTFSEGPRRTVDEILRDADLAMYEAKAQGRGRIALFDASLHARVVDKLALEADLRRAIAGDGLALHFQPLVSVASGRLLGFEALVRWTHPQRGAVSPAVFVALAEETGLVEALTDWVVEQAVAQMTAWQRERPAARGLTVNVNVSSRDLARPSLVTHVREVLARHKASGGLLTLEITETTLMGRLDTALTAMRDLRDLGVRFAIDDFGTGYSSLAYLGTLPIDSLKIDRSFVQHLDSRPQNIEIVRAVLNLGHSLGRHVVAEGVEREEEMAVLRTLGVDVAQGYLISRPLSAEAILPLLGEPVPRTEPESAIA